MPFIRNSLLGLLVGAACVIVGIMSVFLLSSRVTLACVRGPRTTDQCEIRSVGKLRSQTQQIRLGDITGASVEHHTDWLRKRGRRNEYRVVLNTKRGPVPLTESFSSGITDKQRTADRINTFLKSSQPSLQIAQSDSGWGFVVGAIFGGVGLMLGSRSLRSSGD
jgi:hypothetical protein